MYNTTIKVRNLCIMEYIVSFFNDFIQNKNLPFCIQMAGITYPDKNYEILRENADIYSIEFIQSGYGHIHVGNSSFTVHENDIYILPIHKRHYYFSDSEEPFQKIWFNISGSLCDTLFRVYELEGIYHIENVPKLYPYFQKILNICENKEFSLGEVYRQCSLVFHELITLLAQEVYQKNTKHSIEHKIKEYIDRNIYDKITREDLERYAFLSYSQITRLFKKRYGVTPRKYIETQKIETAKLLLINTTLSVKQVAFMLNFADEHYFSNVFKKQVGKNPSQFKKR